MNTLQNSKVEPRLGKALGIKLLLALALCILGVTVVNVIAYETTHWPMAPGINHLFRGAVFSVIVLLGIWQIRKLYPKVDVPLGFRTTRVALKTFALGMGLILVPLIITLLATQIFGWGQVSINASAPFLSAFCISFFATLLTDALPEELVFRGLVYSSLNRRFSKGTSSLISILCFALFPLAIVLIQNILGYPVYIGGAGEISASFMITMVFFGTFMQYLRVLTGSVWTSVGFHTIFVFMNQIIGVGDGQLIGLSEMTDEGPGQITLITLVILIFIGLIIYPYLTKKPLHWKERLAV